MCRELPNKIQLHNDNKGFFFFFLMDSNVDMANERTRGGANVGGNQSETSRAVR